MTKIDMNVINDRKMIWWREEVYGTELMGMRLLRKKTRSEMGRVIGEDSYYLSVLENHQEISAPPPIVGMYMQYLSCGMNHVHQFRDIMNGESKTFEEGRYIGAPLKRQVYKKCHNKCKKCKGEDNLHIHHIKEFAKGGKNELSNLILLCAKCHADVHKDNASYSMLKSMSER